MKSEDCHQSDHDLIVEFVAHAIVGSIITLFVLLFAMVIHTKCFRRNNIRTDTDIDLV